MSEQNSLFEDLPIDPYLGQTKDSLSLVISVPKLGAQQRLFNDWLAKIEKYSQELEALKQLELQHGADRAKKLQPLELQMLELHEKFVVQLDQRLQTPKGLSKKQFSDVSYVAAVMADSLELAANMSGKPLRPELQEVVDRLCVILDGEDAETDEVWGAAEPQIELDTDQELAEVKRMMSEMTGIDLAGDFGADAKTAAEYMEMVMQKMQTEREAAQAEHKAKHYKSKKSAKQQKAEQEALQETMDADTALRIIYRKLASALHPDREPDEAERLRKTQLMGQVNAANDAKDLLTLLRLQLQVEQINPLAIATMADDKLKSYNRMLKDQAKTVQIELKHMQDRLRSQWGLITYKPINLDSVESTLRGKINHLKSQNANMQEQLYMIQDDKYLKAWVKEEIRQLADSQANSAYWL